MQYRALTNPSDFATDVGSFLELVGEGDYRKAMKTLRRGLNHKGFVTLTDDVRFSLELQLDNIEDIRIKSPPSALVVPDVLHEGRDFLIGLGQTIRHLSKPARKKLRGMIYGGLKTNGLRSLQQEMRVACLLSLHGFDVDFADIEDRGNCDFLARKGNSVFEVEAKTIPIYSGYPILPQDADKLFTELRRGFNRWTDTANIPILDIALEGGLSPRRENLLALVSACNTVIEAGSVVTLENTAAVKMIGTIPDAPLERVLAAALIDRTKTGVHVYVSDKLPRTIVRLHSSKPDHFAQNILDALSDAAKHQLTKSNPGILWMHIDYIGEQQFARYARPDHLLDRLASNVLRAYESHVAQVVFSGSAYLHSDGTRQKSAFRRVVYQPGGEKWSGTSLFQADRMLRV